MVRFFLKFWRGGRSTRGGYIRGNTVNKVETTKVYFLTNFIIFFLIFNPFFFIFPYKIYNLSFYNGDNKNLFLSCPEFEIVSCPEFEIVFCLCLVPVILVFLSFSDRWQKAKTRQIFVPSPRPRPRPKTQDKSTSVLWTFEIRTFDSGTFDNRIFDSGIFDRIVEHSTAIDKSKKNWKELANKKILWNIRQWRLFFIGYLKVLLNYLPQDFEGWNSKFFCLGLTKGVGGGQATSKTLLRLLFNKNITFLNTCYYDIILTLQPVRHIAQTYNTHTYSTLYTYNIYLYTYICTYIWRNCTFYKNP